VTNAIYSRYYIVLKDQSGTKLHVFDNYIGFTFENVLNDEGFYTIAFYDDDDDRFDDFQVDGQVEFYRSVPGASLDWYLEFEGLHRDPSRGVDKNGRKIFTSEGVGYNNLLARRVIGYKQGTVRAEKDNYVEDVMKEFVSENLGSDAGHASRVRNGIMTNFTVEAVSAVHDQTANWKGEKSFVNILDVLKEIANYSQTTTPTSRSMDFAVVNNGDGNFIFRTYIDQKGDDRTIDSSTATPVLFSPEFGNLQSARYQLNRISELNAAIVLGRGERSTRKVIVRESIDGSDSPWNDIEVARAASLNEFEYQLNNFGDSLLAQNSYKEILEGEILQTQGTLYGRDYFLGDLCTFTYGLIQKDKKIVGVRISAQEKQGDTISVALDDISRS